MAARKRIMRIRGILLSPRSVRLMARTSCLRSNLRDPFRALSRFQPAQRGAPDSAHLVFELGEKPPGLLHDLGGSLLGERGALELGSELVPLGRGLLQLGLEPLASRPPDPPRPRGRGGRIGTGRRCPGPSPRPRGASRRSPGRQSLARPRPPRRESSLQDLARPLVHGRPPQLHRQPRARCPSRPSGCGSGSPGP